jgi:cell division protein FtsW (lipid II flippase)
MADKLPPADRDRARRLVGVATAAYMAYDPKTEIIPLVLGILGFTFGSLLAVFLLAVFTKTRGNDFGNVLAMICGFVAVVFFSNARLQELVVAAAFFSLRAKKPEGLIRIAVSQMEAELDVVERRRSGPELLRLRKFLFRRIKPAGVGQGGDIGISREWRQRIQFGRT